MGKEGGVFSRALERVGAALFSQFEESSVKNVPQEGGGIALGMDFCRPAAVVWAVWTLWKCRGAVRG